MAHEDLSREEQVEGSSDRVFGLVIAGAFVVIAPFTPLKHWLESPDAAARWFRGFGSGGVALFGTVMVVSIVVGVPRLLFCPIAGALFGFWNGLALSLAGSLLSYYLVFLFVRGRPARGNLGDAGPRPPLHPRLAFLQGDPGVAGVILARLVPLPGALPTLALATSGVGHGAYLSGSAVGLIPEAVPFVLAGSGVVSADASHIARWVVGVLACVAAAWTLKRYVARNLAATRDRVER